MKLDTSSLSNAINSLEKAINYSKEHFASHPNDGIGLEVIRAGVIQNFEFTYEICWKMIKRWLDNNYSESYTIGFSRRQIFRAGAENLLIKDFELWLTFHELRNKTSHTYDPEIAEEIYNQAENFLREAELLLSSLEARND
ncbi:MAG: hypothetical protein A2Y33_02590 [Spirochaetes bacterium GWF1_51_8]|nr:MAG: hypothetical protein A2Y33_02590 [Spirochaetes bacterium GWF1_51_8]